MYYQHDFSPDEFRRRRQAIAKAIGPGAHAVLAGAAASGAFDLFRQTNDFYYLSGVEVPHAYLRIEGGAGSSTLYLLPHDPKHEHSEGPELHCDRPEEVAALTGIDRVAPLAALAEDVASARALYLPHAPAEGRQACRDTLRHQRALAEADPWDGRPTREEHLRSRIAAAAPAASLADLSPVLDEMRLLKSREEIALMRRAGELTARAVLAAMRRTRPGLYEYQLAAEADYVYADAGARGAGYRAIVAAGANIWNPHYFRNDCLLAAGDLVLMDYAPDLGGYTSDIGRTWPVDGRYSPDQRTLVGFVVAYHEALLQVIRPGRSVAELAGEAARRMQPAWQSWPFASDRHREAARKMLHSEVAFTHPVGMAVHDVGDYRRGPLAPGLVFALDPQMWVPEERLYVRIEDTVAVTGTGVEVLTAAAPRALHDVEALVGAGGSP
jgi:Xaa-Pro aminopeptidase